MSDRRWFQCCVAPSFLIADQTEETQCQDSSKSLIRTDFRRSAIHAPILLKGLINAIRGVSFAVPAGLGLQEGGYIALGALLGMPADFMLALSLATRVRELAPSIPLLIAWQQVEGRALWRRRSTATEPAPDQPPGRG